MCAVEGRALGDYIGWSDPVDVTGMTLGGLLMSVSSSGERMKTWVSLSSLSSPLFSASPSTPRKLLQTHIYFGSCLRANAPWRYRVNLVQCRK